MNAEPARRCHCGGEAYCAYDRPVVFFRADTFYFITGTACEDWAVHAELNPGTLRIETLFGERLWPEGMKQ